MSSTLRRKRDTSLSKATKVSSASKRKLDSPLTAIITTPINTSPTKLLPILSSYHQNSSLTKSSTESSLLLSSIVIPGYSLSPFPQPLLYKEEKLDNNNHYSGAEVDNSLELSKLLEFSSLHDKQELLNFDYQVIFYKDENILFINNTIQRFRFPEDFNYHNVYKYFELGIVPRIADRINKNNVIIKKREEIRINNIIASPFSPLVGRNSSPKKSLTTNPQLPWHFMKSWSEYSQIKNGDVVLTVEYCCDCLNHDWMTSHIEKKYLEIAESVKERIENLCLTRKIKFVSLLKPINSLLEYKYPTRFYKGGVSRLGACEVQLAIMKNDCFYCHLVHSKLASTYWPDLDNIEIICQFLLEGSGKKISNFLPPYENSNNLKVVTHTTACNWISDINGNFRFLPPRSVLTYSFIDNNKNQSVQEIIKEMSLISDNNNDDPHDSIFSNPIINTPTRTPITTPPESTATSPRTPIITTPPIINRSVPTTPRMVEMDLPIIPTPIIVWPTPDPIIYNTLLSEKQLNAFIDNNNNNEGRFVYEPVIGTKLSPGNHFLKVVFIPHDSTNFSLLSSKVIITVERYCPDIIWNNPLDIYYNTELSVLQLNAICSQRIDGRFEYNPSFREILSAGIHTLKVMFQPFENNLYNISEKSVIINILPLTCSLEWRPIITMTYGDCLDKSIFNAKCSYPDIVGRYKYNHNENEILPVGTHDLIVIFTPDDIINYNNSEKIVTITIEERIPKVIWDTISNIEYSTLLSETQLNAICLDEFIPGSFTYSPNKGQLLLPGVYELTATFYPDSPYISSIQKKNSITVEKKKLSIIWNNPPSIEFGEVLTSFHLNATLNFKWNESIGTFIYNHDLETSLPVGNNILTVQFIPHDNSLFSDCGKQVMIKVKPSVSDLYWTSPLGIIYGVALGPDQLNAKCINSYYNVPGKFWYDPDIGKVLSPGIHDLSVMFVPENQIIYPALVKNVAIVVSKVDLSLEWIDPKSIIFGEKLSSNQLNAVCIDSGVSGVYHYIPESGDQLEAGIHLLKVTFYPTRNDLYNEISKIVNINVEPRKLKLFWENPDDLISGTALSVKELNAKCIDSKVTGRYIYHPNYGEILRAGDHKLSVVFIPDDERNYLSTEMTANISIRKIIPLIIWNPIESFEYGTTLSEVHLNASISMNQVYNKFNGMFCYEPFQVGTILSPGIYDLQVTFIPFDGEIVETVKTNNVVTVSKKLPTLEWTIRPEIIYEELLDESILNTKCTNDIEGIFIYHPPIGTKLEVGKHDLECDFFPTYSDLYLQTICKVSINVVRAIPKIVWNTPVPIIFNTPLSELQLNASCLLSSKPMKGEYIYKPSMGKVLCHGIHTLKVIFNPEDTEFYSPIETFVYLDVRKSIPIVFWDEPQSIVFGTRLSELQLNAYCGEKKAPEIISSPTSSPGKDKSFHKQNHYFKVFSTPSIGPMEESKNNIIQQIDGSFKYDPKIGSILKPGSHILKVVFRPIDDNYGKCEKSVVIEVTKQHPTVVWNIPEAIFDRQPLSTNQLNAKCVNIEGNMVPGSYKYEPCEGTLLNMGVHDLTVTFAPKNSELFECVKFTVQLIVKRYCPMPEFHIPTLPCRICCSEIDDTIPSSDILSRRSDVEILWANPNSILIGTPLSNNILNARCVDPTIEGIFEYYPPIGTILNFGKHRLRVVFYPSDETYFKSEKIVNLTVTKRKSPIFIWKKKFLHYKNDIDDFVLIKESGIKSDGFYSDKDIEIITKNRRNDDPIMERDIWKINNEDILKFEGSYDDKELKSIRERTFLNIIWGNLDQIVYGTPLGIDQLNAKCSNPLILGSFRYEPSEGIVLKPGIHFLHVSFIPFDEKFSTCNKTVDLLVLKQSPRIIWSSPEEISFGVMLSWIQLNAICVTSDLKRVPGCYRYNPSEGSLLQPGQHQLRVQFSPDDEQFYNSTEYSVTLSVIVGSFKLIWNDPLNIIFGTPLSKKQLNATCSNLLIEGIYEYEPKEGVMLNTGSHSLRVTFKPFDNNYTGNYEKVVTILVVRQFPRIVWNNPDAIFYGDSLSSTQLNAKCLARDDSIVSGSFNYNPSEGAVLKSGIHNLFVSFSPDDKESFGYAQLKVQLTVMMRPLDIIWNNPDEIIFGTPISDLQLNARCSDQSVKGSFTYEPNVGSLLKPGLHTLKVAFSPVDNHYGLNYEKNVKLLVKKYVESLPNSPPIIDEPAPVALCLYCDWLRLTCPCPEYTRCDRSPRTRPPILLDPPRTTHKFCLCCDWSKFNFPCCNYNYTYTSNCCGPNDFLRCDLFKFCHNTPDDNPINIRSYHYYSPVCIIGLCFPCLNFNETNSTVIDRDKNLVLLERNIKFEGTRSDRDCDVINNNNDNITSFKDLDCYLLIETKSKTEGSKDDKYCNITRTVNLNHLIVIDEPLPKTIVEIHCKSEGSKNDRELNNIINKRTTESCLNDIFSYNFQSESKDRTDGSYNDKDPNTFAEKIGVSLIWEDPRNITYGTFIGSNQLNAKCSNSSIKGSFIYQPVEGSLLSPGFHELTVNFQPYETKRYKESSLLVSIVVMKQYPRIIWDNPDDIIFGEILSSNQLNAICILKDDLEVPGTYKYNPPIGSLLNAGKHELFVSFIPYQTTYYGEAYLKVKLTVKVKETKLEWKIPTNIIYTTPISGKQLCARCDNINVIGKFEYSPPIGTVLMVGSHELKVLYIPDNSNYGRSESSVVITVIKYTPKIVWKPENIIYGTPLGIKQLCAKIVDAIIPGKFEYNSDFGSFGALLNSGKRKLEVLFIPDSTINYESVKLKVNIQVDKYSPLLTWDCPETILFGHPLTSIHLNARCVDNNISGQLKYNPGINTILGAGTYKLQVTFTPNDMTNYNEVVVSKNIQIVEKITPKVIWNPTNIIYGTPLGVNQLCAKVIDVNISGRFEYNPPLGCVLDSGRRTLEVLFTPDMPVTYRSVKMKVIIQVDKYSPILTWNCPETILFGQPLTSTYMHVLCVDNNIPGHLTYNPAANTILGIGAYKLQATFTPDNITNNKEVSITKILTVVNLVSKLIWNTPKEIEYGELLSDQQLNATTDNENCKGEFFYEPPHNSKLGVGSHKLTVTFVPQDDRLGACLTTSVRIVVVKASPVLVWNHPSFITYPEPLTEREFCARCFDPSVTGTFYYSHSIGTVLGIGSHVISVLFSPDDKNLYIESEASFELIVKSRRDSSPQRMRSNVMNLGSDSLVESQFNNNNNNNNSNSLVTGLESPGRDRVFTMYPFGHSKYVRDI